LSEINTNAESPIFAQFSALNQEKYESLKILKFNQNIEVLKQYCKIFTYDDVWEF